MKIKLRCSHKGGTTPFLYQHGISFHLNHTRVFRFTGVVKVYYGVKKEGVVLLKLKCQLKTYKRG